MKLDDIAKLAHEINRAYCQSIGDNSQKPWHQASASQRASCLVGVRSRIGNPGAPVSWQHASWMADKLAHGWKYGPVKDEAKKEHPCLVEYDKLPAEQRAKDALFVAVVATCENL